MKPVKSNKIDMTMLFFPESFIFKGFIYKVIRK